MKHLRQHPVIFLAAGVLLGVLAALSFPSERLTAATASGSEKFSMCTVETSARGVTTEAVVVLDHLTGTLTVNVIGPQGFVSKGFSYQCAADFALNAATPEPHYVLVSGQSNNQVAGFSSGVIYVGELSSGLVAAYQFPAVSGRAVPGIKRVGVFPWRVAIGG